MSGVVMTSPPPGLVASLDRQVKLLVGELPADKRGAIVTVATTTGMNVAVVARVADGWQVQAFVGKQWGETVEGGGSIVKSW
jgi:hypothetical protein